VALGRPEGMTGSELLQTPAICEPGGSGLLLPFGDHAWDPNLRALLYLVALLYSFFGVAIVADMFMASIEAITMKRTQWELPDGRIRTGYVWNDTVANLTLMALGSSAPEIFLSLIDMFRSGMHASDLGSSTIVGSAAFNLLVIVAVCIASIPDGEIRLIEHYPVFLVTAIFSLLAYLWLALILSVVSPDRVEVWEAVATLLILPALVWLSYQADRGRLSCGAGWVLGRPCEAVMDSDPSASPSTAAASTCSGSRSESPASGATTGPLPRIDSMGTLGDDEGQARRPRVSDCDLRTRRENSCGAQASHVISERSPKMPSFRVMRLGSFARSASISSRSTGSISSGAAAKTMLRALSGGPGTMAEGGRLRRKSIASHHHLGVNRLRRSGAAGMGRSCSNVTDGEASSAGSAPDETRDSVIQFLVDRQCASTCLSTKPVTIVRTGAAVALRVEYKIFRCVKPVATVSESEVRCALDPETDGRQPGADWTAYTETELLTNGYIFLEALQNEASITCDTMPFDGACGDFIVSMVEARVVERGRATASVGNLRSTYVYREIAAPGALAFAFSSATVPGALGAQVVDAVVCRIGGCKGSAQCHYSTEGMTAVPGVDYTAAEEGLLHFTEGITEMRIRLHLLPKQPRTVARKFLLVLKASEDASLESPAAFRDEQDGGKHSAIMTVVIDEVPECPAQGVGKMLDKSLNFSSVRKGASDWKEQFKSAVLVNGSWDAQHEASWSDWVTHLLSMPWMLAFSLIPPTTFGGGWWCFCMCLVWIAALTAIIADLAELFGCVLGIPDIITAITFVALGTSMPDLFASKVAATEDPSADASIVNVTGSNSVNVFLGLGLPWTIAAIYWELQDRSELWELRYPGVAAMYPQRTAVFAMPSASLGFSVIVFSSACFGAMGLIVLRRRKIGGELGGDRSKYATVAAFILYWLGFVCVVGWRALRHGKATAEEETTIIGSVAAFEFCVTAMAALMTLREAAAKRGCASSPPNEGAKLPHKCLERVRSNSSVASQMSVPSEPEANSVVSSATIESAGKFAADHRT